MPRILDEDFFDGKPTIALDTSDSIFTSFLPNIEAGKGLEQVEDYLGRRSQAFQSMTQRKGAPMTYGAQKKDKH